MNGKFLLGTLAAAVIGFFGGWLVWGILLMDYFEAHTSDGALALEKEEPVMWAMIVANIAYGFVVTWVLSKTHSTSAAKGAVTAVIVFGIITLGMNLFYYAVMEIYTGLEAVVVDTITGAIFAAIIGAVVGWIPGRGSESPATSRG
jgi:hypothetical protein